MQDQRKYALLVSASVFAARQSEKQIPNLSKGDTFGMTGWW